MAKKLAFTLLAATLLIASFPLSAQAQSTERERTQLTEETQADRLDRVKQRVINQIERRLGAIDRFGNKVAKAKHITDDHAAALRSDYATASGVLTAGLDAVAAVETLEELREVAPPIFENTLVFALLGPKTHAVIASDSVGGIAARYDRVAARLQDALDRLAASGVDTTDAQADLDAAIAIADEAAAAGSAVADSVIGLQPGDEIEGPLGDAKTTLQRTRSQLGEARDLAKQVAKFIRSQVGDLGEDA